MRARITKGACAATQTPNVIGVLFGFPFFYNGSVRVLACIFKRHIPSGAGAPSLFLARTLVPITFLCSHVFSSLLVAYSYNYSAVAYRSVLPTGHCETFRETLLLACFKKRRDPAMNHKKLAHKTVNAAETVFIKGQEYYRSGKAFVYITCIVDEAFASAADIPKAKFQRAGTDTECYLTDEERFYLETVFNGYLELGYKPFDAAHRAFTPIVYSRMFPVSSGTWFKVQLDLLAEKQQRSTK